MRKIKQHKSEWDVHFKLTGFYQITAYTREEADEIATQMIKERIQDLESIMHTGLEDPSDEYVEGIYLYQEVSDYGDSEEEKE